VKLVVVNAKDAQVNLFKLMETLIAANETVTITGRTGNVVMLSEAEYRSMQETMYLCGIPGMQEKLIAGRDTPVAECVVDDAEW
jgi:PHD/YefM family antitoxin component YafN of YafNO toxin-antitoxin module